METLETIPLTGAQVRKLARLMRLHPSNATVKIEWDDDAPEAIQVEFQDEYGYRVPGHHAGVQRGQAFVIRENGWSNPSVRLAAEALAQRELA